MRLPATLVNDTKLYSTKRDDKLTNRIESLVNGIVPIDTNNYVGCINVDYLRDLIWVVDGNVAV